MNKDTTLLLVMSMILNFQTMEIGDMEKAVELLDGILTSTMKLTSDYSLASEIGIHGLNADGILMIQAFLDSGESQQSLTGKSATQSKLSDIHRQLSSSLLSFPNGRTT